MLVAAADEAVAGALIVDPGAAAADLAGVAPEARIQIWKNLNTPHQPAAFTPALCLHTDGNGHFADSQEMHQDSKVPDKWLHTSPDPMPYTGQCKEKGDGNNLPGAAAA